MSPYQFGTLKYLRSNRTHVQNARNLHMGTLGSLAQRGWITQKEGFIELTSKGFEAFNLYSQAKPNLRLHEADISEHVRDLLRIRLLTLTRKAG